MNEKKQQRQYQIIVVGSLADDFLPEKEADLPAPNPYNFLHGGTNENASHMATEVNPDLILLDGEISSTGVLEAIIQIKNTAHLQDIPIMIATCMPPLAEPLCLAMEAGAIDFICKPIHKKELYARIHIALHLRKNEQCLKHRHKEMEQLTETLFLLNETIEEKNQELYQSVITDSLTKIYNRAFLLETLAKEFSRNRRHNHPLSCIMIDIDHFKSFNDLYSHKVGDFILIQLTAAIQTIIRNEDIFGRLGGEEFLLILPGCCEEDSQIVAEKVRLYIENNPFVYDNITLNPRISLGVADNAIGRPLKFDDLIHHADLALYEAKRSGRNKTVLFSAINNKNIN